MAWIESNQEIGRHPKTKKLARLLDMRLPEAVGTLHYLWWWALDFAQDGDLSRFDVTDIAEAVFYEGEPDTLISALVEAGFLEKKENGLFIHDWFDYAGKLIERRVKDRVRKRNVRNNPSCSDGIPTDSDGSDADGARIPTESFVEYSTVPNRTLPDSTLPGGEPDAQEKTPPPPPTTRESLVKQYGKALTETYLKKVGRYGHTGDKGLEKAAEWLAADVASGKIRLKPKKEPSFNLEEYGSFAEKFKPVYKNGGDNSA